MDRMTAENKQLRPDNHIKQLTHRIGEAEARGDAAEAKALRKELDQALASRDNDEAERQIQAARDRIGRDLEVAGQIADYALEVERLEAARASLGERMRPLVDELDAIWTEHERLLEEKDKPLRSRRVELVNRVRRSGLDLEVPSARAIAESMDVPAGYLHPTKLLVANRRKYDGVRPEPFTGPIPSVPRMAPAPPPPSNHDRVGAA